jgi:hypothetical protein
MGLLLDTQATRSTLMSVDSTLSETITASQDYIPIASTTSFSTSVVAEIETTNEVVSFDSITTNILIYSEQFDNAAWNKGSMDISANAGVAPDGTTTADKLIPNTSNNNQHYAYQGPSLAGSRPFSLFAKADGYDYVSLIQQGSAGNSAGVQFKLSDGTITASQLATGTITDAGDGWYRCSMIPTTASSSNTMLIQPNDGSTPDTSGYFRTTFAGDGIKGVLGWGAQLEVGVLTGYLPTVASSLSGLTTVTRGANGTTAQAATSGDSIQQLPYALSTTNMPSRLKGLSVTSDGTGAGRLTLCDKVGTTLCDVDIPDNRLYELSWDGGIIFPNGIYVANSDNITAYTLYTDKHSGAGLS